MKFPVEETIRRIAALEYAGLELLADVPPAALPATHAKIRAEAVPAIRAPRGLDGAVVDEECRMGEDGGADLLEPGLDFLGVNFPVNFPVFHIRPPMSTVGCFPHRVSAFTNN